MWTLSTKTKDTDTKKDVSEDAKVAVKASSAKERRIEQLSLFNLEGLNMIANKGFEKILRKSIRYQFKRYGINGDNGGKLQTEWIPLCGKSAGLSCSLSEEEKLQVFCIESIWRSG